MNLKIHSDVKKFVLTSTLKKDDVALIKKYRPEALTVKDEDGNDVFSLGYAEGKSSVAPFGVTFGGANKDGFLIVTGDIPCKEEKPAEYVADYVGAALANINKMEAELPAVATAIKNDRAALIGGITVD